MGDLLQLFYRILGLFLVFPATFRNFLKKKYLFCHVLLEWKVAIAGEEEINGTWYYTKLFGVPCFICVTLCLGVVKFSVQLHPPSGSMEQIWCELLWPCPSCSDWHCLSSAVHAEWLFRLKKASPHPKRASFQLLELPEIVFCHHSLVFVLVEEMFGVAHSRECGTAAAWIYVCLNSCGSDALSLLFTSAALLCILWIVGSGTGFSPGMVKSSFPQAFHRYETLGIIFF